MPEPTPDAVAALAEVVNETSLGTVKWDTAPDGYRATRLHAARLYIEGLREMGYILTTTSDPDARLVTPAAAVAFVDEAHAQHAASVAAGHFDVGCIAHGANRQVTDNYDYCHDTDEDGYCIDECPDCPLFCPLCPQPVPTDAQPLADKIAADLRAEGAAPFRRALETLLIDLAYTQGGNVGLMPAVQEARALLATTPTEGER